MRGRLLEPSARRAGSISNRRAAATKRRRLLTPCRSSVARRHDGIPILGAARVDGPAIPTRSMGFDRRSALTQTARSCPSAGSLEPAWNPRPRLRPAGHRSRAPAMATRAGYLDKCRTRPSPAYLAGAGPSTDRAALRRPREAADQCDVPVVIDPSSTRTSDEPLIASARPLCPRAPADGRPGQRAHHAAAPSAQISTRFERRGRPACSDRPPCRACTAPPTSSPTARSRARARSPRTPRRQERADLQSDRSRRPRVGREPGVEHQWHQAENPGRAPAPTGSRRIAADGAGQAEAPPCRGPPRTVILLTSGVN